MWWRRRHDPARCPDAVRRIEQARQARAVSEEHLAEVRRRWPEVHEVAAELRNARQRNHFADLFRQALGGDRQ
ncbi:MAG TPA: hypothetical protein VIS29_06900 [Streptomyces sp.]|jgi:hypothetical protein